MKKVFKENQIQEIAKDVLGKISKKELDKATVVAFYGDLGAGKTTLASEIARQLGIKKIVTSPTFTIMKKYELPDGEEAFLWKNLIHIDAYRLKNGDDLMILGWKEISENKENLIIVEWPENVISCLETDICRLELSHVEEDLRQIEFLV